MENMTPSKILFYLCLSFIAGVFLGSAIKIPQIFLWGFLFFGASIIIIFLFLEKDFFIIIGFCFLFLSLGIARMQVSEFNVANDKLGRLNGKGEVALAGTVIKEPDMRDAFQKLKVKIEDSTVLVTIKRYPEYNYLDKVKLTGKLETPDITDEFNYKNYLMKDGVYSVMYFPKAELIGRQNCSFYRCPTSAIYSGILWFKQKLRESIRKNYSPPESLILEGTVLGDSGVMPQDLKDKLNTTGLRHIIAVSGTHIVILSATLMFFLLMLGLWRGQAFYFSVVLIWLYIILTGLSASGVRAGIMGTLFLLAQKSGRQSSGSRIITIAGAVMLFQNPLLLFYDVGFQLSFLAAMGIIYFNPIIKKFLEIFFKDKLKNLSEIISSTFSAQIFTLPVMVFNFGNISLIAPVTNLLVLPAVSLLMIFGFVSSFLGVAWQFLGQAFSLPCWFLLFYFIKVLDIFSKPWAMKTIENVHWLWLAVSYLLLSFAVGFLRRLERQKFLGY